MLQPRKTVRSAGLDRHFGVVLGPYSACGLALLVTFEGYLLG